MKHLHDSRPQYLTALSAARQLSKSSGENVICYYDPDYDDSNVLEFCTESKWDIMIDTCQVESSWIFGIINS